MSAYGHEWAYNSKATKPVAHMWPATDSSYRKALCGVWAHDDVLDSNVTARGAPECKRCKAKWQFPTKGDGE